MCSDLFPVLNFSVKQKNIEYKQLGYEWNMQHMQRFEILDEDLTFTKIGWIYHFNGIPDDIRNHMMEKTSESKWKKVLDNILIYNLYVLIIGSIFLGISFMLSLNGNSNFYNLFQKLWYPVFIPSLSLFFTAILIEAIFNKVTDQKKK